MRVKSSFEKPGIDWLARTYLRACRRELAYHAILSDIQIASIYSDAIQTWSASIEITSDRRTKIIFAFCSLVLATFRTVESKAGSSELGFDVASRAVAATLNLPTRLGIRFWLLRWSNPIDRFKLGGLAAKLGDALGPSMSFEEHQRTDGLELIVTSCGFRDFFAMHEELALTKTICAYDHIWMNLMNVSKRNIFVNRGSALSLGDENCQFVFSSSTNEARPVDVVWLDADVQRVAT